MENKHDILIKGTFGLPIVKKKKNLKYNIAQQSAYWQTSLQNPSLVPYLKQCEMWAKESYIQRTKGRLQSTTTTSQGVC